MNSSNKTLDNLFNSLSSIYNKDNSMLNSNLYVLMNAYATVYDDVKRKNTQVKNNTYITTANADALEENFGSVIRFPKPPRLNTLTEGDDIYRFILLTLYQYFLSGSTVATMESALNNVLSLLAIDTRTDDAVSIDNYTTFKFDSTSIELSDRAVKASGGTIVSTATPSDFSISPSGLSVWNYDDANKLISFSGVVNTGVTYTISYFRDNTQYKNTNWMNLTDRNVYSPSPMNLIAGDVATYNNPEFSYWWNTYNADGEGVVVDEFQITEADSPLIFRLPAKSVTYTNPYTNKIVTNSLDFYNISGTAFDISTVSEYNPDVLFSDAPQNYQDQVSGKYQNYYIRYSENNSYKYDAFTQYSGTFTKYVKKLSSIEFPAKNQGTLDFFEKNSDFDPNDLYGYGTKHVWLNVPWDNGKYIISSDYFMPRSFSLHQDIVWKEFFEEDNDSRVFYSATSGIRVTEAPPTSFEGKEDCLSITATGTGTALESAYAYPIIGTGVTSYANHLEVDFYDCLNSGTNTYIDVFRTGTAGEYYQFRLGIESGSFFQVTGNNATPLTLEQSKTWGFVETYFADSGNTTYAVVPSGFPTSNWGLVSGNYFSNLSDYSYSGITASSILPNLTAQQIIDADYFETYLTATGTASRVYLDFRLSRYSDIGGGLGANEFFSLSNSVNDTTFRWNKLVSGIGTNGISSIPVPTGNLNLKLLRGSYIEVNGVSYGLDSLAFGSQQNHPADFWNNGTLGRSANPAGPIIEPYNPAYGDIRSIRLSPAQQTVQHYVFGNNSLRNQFYNLISPDPFSITLSSGSFFTPYYYQSTSTAGTIDSIPKNYINNIPRNKNWHKLIADFGTNYSGMNVSIDENSILTSNIGFSGNFAHPVSMTVNNASTKPYEELSYFDNIEFSYFDANTVLDKYSYPGINGGRVTIATNDDFWEGSMLDVGTVVDNKYFNSEPVSNFQFNVNIKGLEEDFIYIVNDIINRVKPAHTLVVPIYLLEQELNTTALDPIISNASENWETGNPFYNIVIAEGTSPSGTVGDVSGLIRIDGL